MDDKDETRSAEFVDMLDFIALQRWLGIPSCGRMFGARTDLVHYTSALRCRV